MDDSRLQQPYERQRQHAPIMARTTAGERRDRLKRLRRAIERREAEIIEAIRTDLRRSPFESEIAEIHKALMEIGYAVKRLPRWMRARRARTPIVLASTSARVVYEPRGVVLIMAPWNYPFSLIVNPLVAAVAAGNCVVVKPSEKAPATAALLESLGRRCSSCRSITSSSPAVPRWAAR
jgi:aldehyde dehydrogenase (NAD+)